MGGGNLLSFLSQLAYNSGILSKFANFFCSSLSRSLLRLIFFSHKLSDANYSDHPFWDWVSENYNQVYCCMGNHEFYKYFDVATLRNGYCMRIRPNCQNCLAKASVIFSTMITMSMSCVAWPLQRYQPCSTHRPFRL